MIKWPHNIKHVFSYKDLQYYYKTFSSAAKQDTDVSEQTGFLNFLFQANFLLSAIRKVIKSIEFSECTDFLHKSLPAFPIFQLILTTPCCGYWDQITVEIRSQKKKAENGRQHRFEAIERTERIWILQVEFITGI